MAKPKKIASKINTGNSNRHQWISVAAYFKAEATGFEQGKDLDNWLEAEIEYNDFQIQTFILHCQEDGGISINSLQGLAKLMSIPNAMQITNKAELIREIQKVTNHHPCFQATYQEPCADNEPTCHWRKECQQLIAIWYR